ncbi:NADH-quinone oxidoreductase subunit D 1 [Catellatospora methionotrophica]|uniref:NADH-quinone oxidoreductase subunit D n=1 Tax=Catellatospora methionotrophica TaxID=121620 RepID=A0A8J3PGK3_9ACTN|nr:NADH-quinone oxidoreductase subunit D [Catellatospora methionotrophica]GIG14381.1 NADH-quinone oxidoreductase subunit D 1 [Catellatospora methionotrophica]
MAETGGTRQLTVGAGAGAQQLGTDMVLNIGPQHPSTHGVLRLKLVLDGEKVLSAEPIIGYMHRGAEKLFEVRDYRQILVLANRHDWLSAFSNELGAAMAVERLMGLEVPERAVWLRMAMAELNRVLNHLMFLGSYPLEIGAITPVFYAFREREVLQAVMEEATGGRMHYMFNRIGGLKEEVPAGWTRRAREAVDLVASRMPMLDDLIRRNDIFLARTVGVGVLSAAQAAAYGASGPVGRASGLDFDLRRDEPYLAYGELDVPVVTRTAGDCHARFEVLLDQVYVSLDLVRQCLDRVDRIGGPVNVRLPKVVKAPEGHTYTWTENPLGVNGYYLVSKGDKTPWRMKLRTASYANVQALSTLLPGTLVPDLIAILGSMFFVVGDIDK